MQAQQKQNGAYSTWNLQSPYGRHIQKNKTILVGNKISSNPAGILTFILIGEHRRHKFIGILAEKIYSFTIQAGKGNSIKLVVGRGQGIAAGEGNIFPPVLEVLEVVFGSHSKFWLSISSSIPEVFFWGDHRRGRGFRIYLEYILNAMKGKRLFVYLMSNKLC